MSDVRINTHARVYRYQMMAVIAALCVSAPGCPIKDPFHQDVRDQVIRDMTDVQGLLMSYGTSHHEAPFDTSGETAALRRLREICYVKKGHEMVLNKELVRAIKAVSEDWKYWNASGEKFDLDRIYFVSKQRKYGQWYIATPTLISSHMSNHLSSDEMSQYVLGKWLAMGELVFESKDLLEDWERTHICPDGWSESAENLAENEIRRTFDRSIEGKHCHQVVDYQEVRDKSGQLVEFNISHKHGRFNEKMERDEYGRIIRIQRSPENWEDVWNRTFRPMDK